MRYFYLKKIGFRIILSLIWIIFSEANAQTFSHSECIQELSLQKFADEKLVFRRQQSLAETAASAWFDVTYYCLALEVFTQPNNLKGKVTIQGICLKDSAGFLTLDLVNQMRVDSVLVDGRNSAFVQNSNSFNITFDRSYRLAEIISIDVFYEGVPIATGLGSFVFDSHDEIPWVYTLSEPYGAKDWWPCKNDPSDKADSADIIITCDSTFKVGSQGILISVTNNGNGTSTHFWKERYPIASYLISVAITNYTQFSNWFRYSDTDSMEVLNYVLPEHDSTALQNLPRAIDMLKIFSELFGRYPFIKEKYGHVEFGRGGAMEHQTMTSTTTFDENTIAHELAHQWFGDMITCRSWSELWLNEGFAQYSTALYLERRYGIESYWAYMKPQFDQAQTAQRALGNPDTTDVKNLFYSALVYSKGSSVLHMLRHVLGDSIFFRALYAYATNPALQYSTATTRDFQLICENISGKNLGYFFQEWIYGKGYPVYNYSWTWKTLGDSAVIILDIGQINDQGNSTFFTMPIDIRITAAGRDTMLTVFNDLQQQRFVIKADEKPSSVIIDPENWILKYVYSDEDRLPSAYVLEQNYPNPFNSTTNIVYRLRRQEDVTIKIYDILGREIATLLDKRQMPGVYKCQWTPTMCASGIYFCCLVAGNVYLQKKMVLLK